MSYRTALVTDDQLPLKAERLAKPIDHFRQVLIRDHRDGSPTCARIWISHAVFPPHTRPTVHLIPFRANIRFRIATSARNGNLEGSKFNLS
jgi:hypothetical protein